MLCSMASELSSSSQHDSHEIVHIMGTEPSSHSAYYIQHPLGIKPPHTSALRGTWPTTCLAALQKILHFSDEYMSSSFLVWDAMGCT